MKLAVPTRENMVDSHFGHCEYYTIIEVNEKNEVISKSTMESPVGCGCKSDIASILKDDGVTIMLAGNMGNGALNVLSSNNIKVIRGCEGPVDKVIEQFLNNELSDSGVGCASHEHHQDHTCNHQ